MKKKSLQTVKETSKDQLINDSMKKDIKGGAIIPRHIELDW